MAKLEINFTSIFVGVIADLAGTGIFDTLS